MQVFDCFTFFNEVELLEVRFEELNPVVDWFVLVEAARTFSDKPKPFIFQENKARFAKYLHKIVPVSLPYMPQNATSWALEAFQRNAIQFGLSAARPEDYVMISDLDEIPRAASVRDFVAAGGEAAALGMPTYYYKFNCKNVSGEAEQALTVISRYRSLPTPQQARARRFSLPLIRDAGWHFSYLGDEERILEKIESFSHQELNTPEFANSDRIRARAAGAQDLYERPGYSWAFVPLDETFPKFVRDNQTRFSDLIQTA